MVKSIHNSERKNSDEAVILGSGPSINDLDEKYLKGKDIWTSNMWYFHPTIIPDFWHMEIKEHRCGPTSRKLLSDRYDKLLKNFPVQLPCKLKDRISGLHLYVICLKEKGFFKKTNDIIDFLRQRGIGVHKHYIPIYRQPYYKDKGFSVKKFPNSEKYFQQAITLPFYPLLKFYEQDKVVTELSNAIKLNKHF